MHFESFWVELRIHFFLVVVCYVGWQFSGACSRYKVGLFSPAPKGTIVFIEQSDPFFNKFIVLIGMIGQGVQRLEV